MLTLVKLRTLNQFELIKSLNDVNKHSRQMAQMFSPQHPGTYMNKLNANWSLFLIYTHPSTSGFVMTFNRSNAFTSF